MMLPDYQESVLRFVQAHQLEISVTYRLLDVVSEVGELAKEILKDTHYGQTAFETSATFKEELADVFFSLICVANSCGINLDEALRAALAKYEARLHATGDAASER